MKETIGETNEIAIANELMPTHRKDYAIRHQTAKAGRLKPLAGDTKFMNEPFAFKRLTFELSGARRQDGFGPE